MELEPRPPRHLQRVIRWHLCADGAHQRNSTQDSWAPVITADDEQGYMYQGSTGAHNNISFRDDNFPGISATSELAALIWACAWMRAQLRAFNHKPDVTTHANSMIARGCAEENFPPKKLTDLM
eukprot:6936509-Pyramimonas_sp.AAC.1